NYTLKLASNGNNFGSAVSFPAGASINNSGVYVIVNSVLNTNCQPSQQDYVNNTITGFNGNDAIGLFKNNVLIDIIGEEGNSANFAQNLTLVRKETVASPNTTYNATEWNTLPQDTCTGLGSHNQTLSVSEIQLNDFKIYPNPIKGNYLTIEIKQNTRFEIYDILGKKIVDGSVTPTNKKINVSQLNKGVYILKLETPNGSTSKKLIKA
ncbi:MAG: T9SS type A sorting domain-containing protein, partial [Lacinutrix sp.]|uniref:T9SS type A sorting domain-containing protein n=1 Tax=Lacinutrix sp. TaxID=1937692 RepID=UPI0030AEA02C